MRTVTLVATKDFVRRFHPETEGRSLSGILSAPFPVDPSASRTALGRWLADTILTTRFEDDASRCQILLPSTEIGLRFRELGERMEDYHSMRSEADFARVCTEIQQFLEKQRLQIKVYGSGVFAYRTIDFQWPVFGSAAAGGADTAEAYFDVCAGLIRRTGGVICSAGLLWTRPPESILRTMAKGLGLVLLEQHAENSRRMGFSVA